MDRAKDMVLRGGENVYCSEVEAAAFAHDAVAEVRGLRRARRPARRGGGHVAVVLTEPGATLSADALRAALRGLASRSSRSRATSGCSNGARCPRNANGKFLKRELRDTLNVADAQ